MRLRREERGASAVEFALIALLLFMVVFGIIQFGIAYNRVQGLQAGGREGARVGSLPTSSGQNVLNRVRDSLSATVGAPTVIQSGQPFSSSPAESQTFLWISRRPAAGGALVPMDAASTPCGSGGAAEGDTIVVSLSNRMIIQIPPVMSFPVTVRSTGEFLCEI